jgi:hypothetical protein
MKKMLPLLGMALGLSLVFGTQAHAVNLEKLENKIEKLQDKLESTQNPNKIERLQTRLDRLEIKYEKQGGGTISNPEPSTILLLGTGMAALGLWRWRKRQ